ncbi:MAG: ABC transporter permease [Clostridium sp.]|nr:ABC transporter permease [Clostridium sp.]MCM1398711.1 ABC transporter permease [Clostridium sp.]MCM1458657.1 ABC transporter permease [Bacteroides sp.]
MTTYIAFLKKEFMEMARTRKLVILAVLFLLFGIMNPAIAKLTPQILKMALESDSFNASGIAVVGEITVNDTASWAQFYKNIPMALIILIIMFSGIITSEYQKGTLVPLYTKGISPVAVYLAKLTTLFLTWTLGYAVTFGITYAYNQYYWQNEAAKNIIFSVFACYLLGVFFLCLMLFLSTFFNSNTAVIVATACIFFVMYIFSIVPDVKKYLPTKLMETNELMVGKTMPVDYTMNVAVTCLLSVAFIAGSCIIIRKKPI